MTPATSIGQIHDTARTRRRSGSLYRHAAANTRIVKILIYSQEYQASTNILAEKYYAESVCQLVVSTSADLTAVSLCS